MWPLQYRGCATIVHLNMSAKHRRVWIFSFSTTCCLKGKGPFMCQKINILNVLKHLKCDFSTFIYVFLLGVVAPAILHQNCAFWGNLPIPVLLDCISPSVSSELSLIERVWSVASCICSAGWLRPPLRISQLLSLWMCHQASKHSLLLWSLPGPHELLLRFMCL